MQTIKINHLLNFPLDSIPNIKVKFNQHNGDVDPMEEYLRDPEIVNTLAILEKQTTLFFRRPDSHLPIKVDI